MGPQLGNSIEDMRDYKPKATVKRDVAFTNIRTAGRNVAKKLVFLPLPLPLQCSLASTWVGD